MKPQIRISVLFAVLTLTMASWAAAAGDFTSESVETYSLSADGRVSLENINGDATFEGWDQDQVRVEWVIKARDQRRLDEVEVVIDARENSISIETDYERRGHRGWDHHDPATVDYTIMVPRGARLRGVELVNGDLRMTGLEGSVEVELVNGDIDARELSGDVELSTVNGRLELELAALEADRNVSLESVNGEIDLIVPPDADAEFRAETVHGRIRNDFGFAVNKDGFVGRDMRGSVGRGGARVTIETVNGSIDIRSR